MNTKKSIRLFGAMLLTFIISFGANIINANAADYTIFSSIFDPKYYVSVNADAKEYADGNIDMLWEYFLKVGVPRGDQASAEFNVYTYVQNYPELVTQLGKNISNYYLHYLLVGKSEGRIANCELVKETAVDVDFGIPTGSVIINDYYGNQIFEFNDYNFTLVEDDPYATQYMGEMGGQTVYISYTPFYSLLWGEVLKNNGMTYSVNYDSAYSYEVVKTFSVPVGTASVIRYFYIDGQDNFIMYTTVIKSGNNYATIDFEPDQLSRSTGNPVDVYVATKDAVCSSYDPDGTRLGLMSAIVNALVK